MPDWSDFWGIDYQGPDNYVMAPPELPRFDTDIPAPAFVPSWMNATGDPLSRSDVLRGIAGNAGTAPAPGTHTPGGNVVMPGGGTATALDNGGSTRYLDLIGQLGAGTLSVLGRVFGPGGAGTYASMPGQVRSFFTSGGPGGLFSNPLVLIAAVVGLILLLRKR